MASTRRSRASAAAAWTSRGTLSSAIGPDGPSAVIVTRSMVPLNDPAEPIGHCSATTCRPKRSARPSTTLANAAFSRSILVTTTIRLRRSRAARLQALSVCTSAPAVASTVMRTLSTARNAPTTSPMKSGYPGVSMRFSFASFHSSGASAALTVIFRRISSGSKSVVVVPSSTRPSRSTALAANSIASTREVFPVLPGPATAMFRILSAAYRFTTTPPGRPSRHAGAALIPEDRIDHVQQRLPSEIPPQVLAEERDDPIQVSGEIPGDVGGDDQPRGRPQRAVGGERFRVEDIEAGAAQPPGPEGRQERRLVDEPAPPDVDQERPVRQRRQFARAHDPPRHGRQGPGDDQHRPRPQHGVDLGRRIHALHARDRPRAPRGPHDAHPKRRRPPGHLGADRAEAQDPHRASRQHRAPQFVVDPPARGLAVAGLPEPPRVP